jgi:tRNA-splicing ligase RtcB
MNYEVLTPKQGGLVKMWTKGVSVGDEALQQVENVASLPFLFKHVAVMPDVHWGMGATVGSVIPTRGAIIPAAVGVDIGCGMMAVRTNISAGQLPDNLSGLRSAIEKVVPHGRTDSGRDTDRGSWADPPAAVRER